MQWQNNYDDLMHQDLCPQEVNRHPTLLPLCVRNEHDPEYASYCWVGSNFHKKMVLPIQDNMRIRSKATASETYLDDNEPMSDTNKGIQDTHVSEMPSLTMTEPLDVDSIMLLTDPTPMIIEPVVGKLRKDEASIKTLHKSTKILLVQDSVIAASMKKLRNEDMATTMKLLYLKGPLSNSEIKDESNLSPSSINHALTRLQESDLVLRVGKKYYITNYGKILVDGVMFILDSIEKYASKIGFEMRSIQR